MVTKEDLNDWLTENECDIFMDAPIEYTDEQWEVFGKAFISNIKEKYGFDVEFDEDWYENIWMSIPSNIDYDDIVEIGLYTLADWMNEYNLSFYA